MVVIYERAILTDTLIAEMTPLLMAHKDEICLYEDFVFNPDWDLYKYLESNNTLRIFTARENGVLIGYAGYSVEHNLHYSDVLHASQDVLYLKPDRRGAMVGVKLIKYADEQLAQMGVKLVSHHVKVNNDFGPLLERMGYNLAEKIYERRLD